MTAPVQLSFNAEQTRAAFRLFHPKGNIVTAEMIAALSQALDTLAQQSHLKLLTIEGVGADFSFGASIPEHAPGDIDRVLPEAHALIHALLDFPAPTAALVRGRCLGGGFEIALACDFIFAEASSTLGLPEIALGVFPPAGCALLPARVGTARATRAILTGQSLPAAAWRETPTSMRACCRPNAPKNNSRCTDAISSHAIRMAAWIRMAPPSSSSS